MSDKAERHRAAQSKYRTSEKGRAKQAEWRADNPEGMQDYRDRTVRSGSRSWTFPTAEGAHEARVKLAELRDEFYAKQAAKRERFFALSLDEQQAELEASPYAAMLRFIVPDENTTGQ
jgi:hypothetical protein